VRCKLTATMRKHTMNMTEGITGGFSGTPTIMQLAALLRVWQHILTLIPYGCG